MLHLLSLPIKRTVQSTPALSIVQLIVAIQVRLFLIKKTLLWFSLVAITFKVHSQCTIPGGQGDSLFPVTNTYYHAYDKNDGTSHNAETFVFNMAKRSNSLFLFGNFTNIASNHGRGILIDSITRKILTQRKWKIDGNVNAAIPDGHGGFYVGGSFEKIGDSVRRNIAQIDSEGKPTAWKISVNSQIKALYRKSDTLFIGGSFTSVNEKVRNGFAIFSLNGDTVLSQSIPFDEGATVNAFKAYNDTLIIGGDYFYMTYPPRNVYKFDTRTLKLMPWTLKTSEYYAVNCLDVSSETGTLFLGTYDFHMRAINLYTGVEKYRVTLTTATQMSLGRPKALKVVGNKLYIGGIFTKVRSASGEAMRKGFCEIDILTGKMTNTDLLLNEFVTHLEAINDKLYLGGYFTTVAGQPREHFAQLDTGSLSLTDWNLAPTDPLSTITISGKKFFVGGPLNGVGSVHRNGFAAIDVTTNEVLPFNAAPTAITSARRMFLQGDSLYILGKGTPLNIWNNSLLVVDINSGQTTELSTSLSAFHDIHVDSNYLYISNEKRLERYRLATLQQDYAWAIDYGSYAADVKINYIIDHKDKLYCLTSGDENRFPKLLVIDKAKGKVVGDWKFTNSQNARVYFDKGVFKNDSLLHVHGIFSNVNGQPRNNFAAFNVKSGQFLNWVTSFENTGKYPGEFDHITSPLVYRDGKLWFGASGSYTISNGDNFSGLGAIDSSANLMPPVLKIEENSRRGFFANTNNIHDFIFDKDYFYAAGNFDLVNGRGFKNIVRLKYTNGSANPHENISITGPDNLAINSDSVMFYVPNAPGTHSYYWTYSGSDVTIKNNGNDTIWLKIGANPVEGILTVKAQDYCGYANEFQKSLSFAGTADLSINQPEISAGSVQAGSSFNVGFIEYNLGSSLAGKNKMKFYLSENNILTPDANGDLFLGHLDINTPIAPNSNTGRLSKQLTISCTMAHRSYFLFVVADAANDVVESNENNNITSISLNVTAGQGVPVIPAIVVSPSDSVCIPDSIKLTANSAGCTSCNYTWSTGETDSSITIKASGAYTVTVRNACGQASASRVVSVSPLPSIDVTANAVTICLGDSITLTAVGATTYHWTGPGIKATTGSAIIAKPEITGNVTYAVKGTSNGCSQDKNITINVRPVAKPSISINYSGCPSNALFFEAIAVNPGTNPEYQWYVDAVVSGYGKTFTLNNATNGMKIYASLTSNHACASSVTVNSTIDTINCIVTTTPDIDGLKKFQIMPNPSNGFFIIKIELTQNQKVSFLITDTFSKEVYSSLPVMLSGTVNKEIDLRGIAAGIYFLTTNIGSKTFTEKIVISR